ncbi:hypothetical protein C8Q72DRAFT_767840 [Fomitopsis betulina]|nr:hypothetical protein C8Q72DRAFT_767840 [Fomitopsis betulina]
MPLGRWSSEGEPSSRKGHAQSIDKKPRNPTRPRSRSANGTKLLNGRVYGAKRNPFANARSEEPEFVEWGYGGMGSVKSSGDGASVWAKVQSGGVNIGAHEQPSGPSRPRPAGDDDDDGSGMAWVKKRRQLKEQENKNNESAAKQTSVSAVKPLASASDHNSPAAKEEAAEDRTLSTSPAQMDVPLQEAVDTPTKEHHLQAVTLPPVHHHHHRGHSHNTLERLSSTGKVENERRDSADTLRNMRPPTAQEPTGVDLVALPEDGRQRTESVKSRLSTSSSSSSGNDDADADADEEDLESPRDGEDEDDEDTEVRAEQSRLTALALGAGVEKISRHKESAPEAGSE